MGGLDLKSGAEIPSVAPGHRPAQSNQGA